MKYLETKINYVDEWKRDMCTKMPMSDTCSNKCITPDGEKLSCSECRYHVDKIYRD